MEEKQIPETEETSAAPEKSAWQQTKEGWYDKIPLSLKQLDWIINTCLVLLGLCFLAICLDALGIYDFFG